MCTDCSCSTVNIQATPEVTEDTIVATFNVTGMTCGGCAGTVTDKLSQLDDVSSVDVDITTGAVTVHSSKPLDDNHVRAAIEDAGYAATPA
jgi:copper chaperone CopZ